MSFIEGYNVETTADLQEALKDLLGGAIQTMLEGELENQIAEKLAIGTNPEKYLERVLGV